MKKIFLAFLPLLSFCPDIKIINKSNKAVTIQNCSWDNARDIHMLPIQIEPGKEFNHNGVASFELKCGAKIKRFKNTKEVIVNNETFKRGWHYEN